MSAERMRRLRLRRKEGVFILNAKVKGERLSRVVARLIHANLLSASMVLEHRPEQWESLAAIEARVARAIRRGLSAEALEAITQATIDYVQLVRKFS